MTCHQTTFVADTDLAGDAIRFIETQVRPSLDRTRPGVSPGLADWFRLRYLEPLAAADPVRFSTRNALRGRDDTRVQVFVWSADWLLIELADPDAHTFSGRAARLNANGPVETREDFLFAVRLFLVKAWVTREEYSRLCGDAGRFSGAVERFAETGTDLLLVDNR